MPIGDLDLAILSFVADNPSSTVTDAAKELFHPDDVEELRRRDTMLRHRYKNLRVGNLLQSEKSGNRTLYSINSEKAIFGAGLQNLEIGGHKWETPDLTSDYCIVLIMDGKVEVHSLDELDRRW
jgi:hypothetical protein|tara:strand:- start:510 stop:881 length:372 start_codon:yes stop_codon:yes gene_type:complete